RRPFSTFRYDPGRPGTLASNAVSAVLETRTRRLLVGTDRGLSVTDSVRQEFRTYPVGADPNVTALFESRSGWVWVGTAAPGVLYAFDPESGRATEHRLLRGDEATASSAAVYAIAEDAEGHLWVGTVGDGLFRYAPETGAVVRFRHDPSRPAGLSSDQVRALAATAGGALWVGTAEGLDRLDLSTARFTHFPLTSDADPADERLLALHAAGDGTLWVGTEGSGLYRLEGDTRTRFTEANSDLPSNTVQAIVEDENGYLWLSTSRGLARFETATETFRVFDSEGATAVRALSRAATRAAGGTLLFGSAEGLLAFSPLQLSAVNPYPPQLVLTG